MDHHWSPCIHLQLAKDAIWSTGWPCLTTEAGAKRWLPDAQSAGYRSDRSDVGPPKRTSRVVSSVVSQIYLLQVPQQQLQPQLGMGGGAWNKLTRSDGLTLQFDWKPLEAGNEQLATGE